MSDFYYGQGKLYLARRNAAGQALSWRWVGDVSALSLELEFDEKKSKASIGGQLVDSTRYVSAINGKVTSTWHEYSKENLEVLLYSNIINKTPNIVKGEILPLGIKAGDNISLRYPNVFGVSVDSLTVGDDYIVDPLWGVITFLKTPTQQPVVDYAYVGHVSLPLINSSSKEFSLRYEGVNLAEQQSHILVELYRVSFDLISNLSLINNDSNLSELETSSVILHDATKLSDSELGQFGRIMKFNRLNGLTHNGAINHDGRYLHGGN
ncbi:MULTISPECIES: phage tail tube protein [Serratia]|uniref:phage tail tube protein n=1 Tax=Serratia TaxID=613 RepID=UPI000744E98B|nr:hypothetical protein [Serratia marcescens]EME1465815.1 hypothetical protein [Serratia marcescens]MDP8622153.1 hypothetical protein [Serratia marcescens]CUZ00501.1 Uncharacterised protein [Serratia marcescens]CUZ13918.1 Uncharacterised protein [Serratia marcescens]CVB77072.1 Uncharacterised protein [Serratia marcescens]